VSKGVGRRTAGGFGPGEIHQYSRQGRRENVSGTAEALGTTGTRPKKVASGVGDRPDLTCEVESCGGKLRENRGLTVLHVGFLIGVIR